MAWPSEAGSIGMTKAALWERPPERRFIRSRCWRGLDPRFFKQHTGTTDPIPRQGRVIKSPWMRRFRRSFRHGEGGGAGNAGNSGGNARTQPGPMPIEIIIRGGRPVSGTPPVTQNRYYVDYRDLYRIFNSAVFRFYKSTTGPPAETDTPFATSGTLPYTPADVFGNGTHYLSVSWFNGVLDSGFLPVGPNGETYLRIGVSGGVSFLGPPQTPINVRLILKPGGVVQVQAVYFELGGLRATQWAITYTTNGSTPGTPPAVSPTITAGIVGTNLSVLQYDLPAQADGVTVNLRLQVRRDDGGAWRYSEGSTVLSAIADALGPAAVEGAGVWRGTMPEEL